MADFEQLTDTPTIKAGSGNNAFSGAERALMNAMQIDAVQPTKFDRLGLALKGAAEAMDSVDPNNVGGSVIKSFIKGGAQGAAYEASAERAQRAQKFQQSIQYLGHLQAEAAKQNQQAQLYTENLKALQPALQGFLRTSKAMPMNERLQVAQNILNTAMRGQDSQLVVTGMLEGQPNVWTVKDLATGEQKPMDILTYIDKGTMGAEDSIAQFTMMGGLDMQQKQATLTNTQAQTALIPYQQQEAAAKANEAQANAARAASGQLPVEDRLKYEQQLRGEVNTQVQRLNDLESSFGKVQQFGQNPNTVSDIALVYAYMKLLDPTSVVREAEFQTAANAMPLLERYGLQRFKNVWTGQLLSPQVRNDMKNTVSRMLTQERQNYKGMLNQYAAQAQRMQLDVRNIMPQLPNSVQYPTVTTQQDFDALPKGAFFYEAQPDGSVLFVQKP
jgi:hypothetical protein